MRALAVVAAMIGVASGCGESNVEPNIPRDEVAGSYRLAALTFDPQGSLPAVDAAARLAALDKPDPALTLLEDGRLQLLFEDPASRLLHLVEGTFRTTPEGIVTDLGSANGYRALLLPRQAVYARVPGDTLVFDGLAPDGVSREALFALVPEWDQEPLVDPVPGTLKIVFEPVS